MLNEEKINECALKIHYFSEAIKGYCDNACGGKTFVECIGGISKEIMDLAYEITQNLSDDW